MPAQMRITEMATMARLDALRLSNFRLPRRGMTLIEVIVSLAILSVCVTFLAQLMLRGMDESRMARERARAVLLAQEHLEEILAHRDDLASWDKDLAERFDFDSERGMWQYRDKDLSRFFWKWEVRRPQEHEGMKEIAVQVRWKVPHRRTLATRCELRMLVAGGPPLPEPAKEEGAP
jgi:prepilin-type N-terminal cleavage/methylation domain-containing protein